MLNLTHEINLATRRPLLDVESAAYLLGLDHARLIAAIEDGRLTWAWDFSVPPARRRELRVWRGSVSDWLRSGGDCGGDRAREDDVISDILPHRDFYTSELKRLLVLHRTTLQHFLTKGLLVSTGQAPRDGVLNLASRIPRASVVEFMRLRRVGWVKPRQLRFC